MTAFHSISDRFDATCGRRRLLLLGRGTKSLVSSIIRRQFAYILLLFDCIFSLFSIRAAFVILYSPISGKFSISANFAYHQPKSRNSERLQKIQKITKERQIKQYQQIDDSGKQIPINSEKQSSTMRIQTLGNECAFQLP